MEAAEPPQPPSLLTQIRNRWELANLMQYIQIFGDAIKIDSEIDIEVRSTEPAHPAMAPSTPMRLNFQ